MKMEEIEILEGAARKHSGVMEKQLSFFQGGKFMQSYADQVVQETVQQRDEEIREWAMKYIDRYKDAGSLFAISNLNVFLSSLPKEPDQPEKVSDNFRINIIPELSRKELEERCIEMYEKIEIDEVGFCEQRR